MDNWITSEFHMGGPDYQAVILMHRVTQAYAVRLTWAGLERVQTVESFRRAFELMRQFARVGEAWRHAQTQRPLYRGSRA